MQEIRPGVYQIRDLETNKRYIGSAVNVWQRFHSHRSKLARGIHDNKYLQAAWHKHGAERFAFEPILFCSKRDLIFFEQRAIDAWCSSDRLLGYNLRKIAQSNVGLRMSDETKKKLSAIVKGRRHTDEARAKISKGNLGKKRPGLGAFMAELHKGNKYRVGKKHTAESIALMSKNRAGKYTGPRPPEVVAKAAAALIGHRVSDETKAKLRAAQKKYQAMRVRTGIDAHLWGRIQDAAALLGVKTETIRQRITHGWSVDRALNTHVMSRGVAT